MPRQLETMLIHDVESQEHAFNSFESISIESDIEYTFNVFFLAPQ